MIGRPRFLRPFWSGSAPVYPATGGNADAALAPVDRSAELDAERQHSQQLTGSIAEMIKDQRELRANLERVRSALLGTGLFSSSDIDLAAGVNLLISVWRAASMQAKVANDRAARSAGEAAELGEALRSLRQASATGPSSTAAQDRRNAVVLCDALALSEGRKCGARLGDDAAVHQLLAAVRKTVGEHLGVDVAEVPSWRR